MRVNTYQLLTEMIEAGIRGGLNKCYKRDYIQSKNHSGEDAAVGEIHQYVMNSICEYFTWDDEKED